PDPRQLDRPDRTALGRTPIAAVGARADPLVGNPQRAALERRRGSLRATSRNGRSQTDVAAREAHRALTRAPVSAGGQQLVSNDVTLTETLPTRYYVDPQIWEIERRQIFAKTWVMIGLEHQIPRAGDYLAEQLAGWPIFVQRAEDGGLRAFHNMCPHRAGPIVWEGTGHQANLVCRYHGWAFDREGALLNARDFGAQAPPGTGLPPVRAQTWRRF